MKEEWRPITCYSNGYEVSNLCRVRSLQKINRKYTCIIKNIHGKGGYLSATLSFKNKPKTFYIHRLVALHFIPNPLNKPDVNHKDYNRWNNVVENLEWATTKENVRYSSEQKRMSGRVGEKAWNSIIKEKDILVIRSSKLTQLELSKEYGVSRECISAIKNKRTWSHIK